MTQVDVSNPDLLRSIDPIRKAVYEEEGSAKFHIGHLHESPPVDLFGWADIERGKKATYEMVGDSNNEGADNWELDVKPLISSTRWLQLHGLKRNRLTMAQILSAIGFKHNEQYVQTLGRPVGSYYGNGLFQQFKRKDGQLYNITVGREKLQKIEEALLRASHLYKRRLQWLTTGSRRIFGVIQEHCICIVLDVSTMSQTQFDLYRESLCEVIRDQVSQLAKFNMIKAQANMQMWQEQAMPVTEVTIKSAIEWVNKLDRMAESSRTGSTEAVMKAMEDDSLEAVYLFAEGDSSELSKELLRQKVNNAPHVLHSVSFNANKSGTIKFLKEISEPTKGRFHAFVVKNAFEEDAEALPNSAAPPGGDASRISVRYGQKARGGIPAGSGVREDVFKVWSELEECRNNHAQVVTLLTEIPDPKTDSTTIEKASACKGKRVEQYMSSKEWLQRHGLEVRKLTAYQELANCSFRHVDGVVDLKGKPALNSNSSDAENVRKLVNAKYCEQFAHTEWKDGSLVHVHITAEQHKNYERRIKTALDAIQKRIDWLQQGSREVFGTILEEQVYILIDTSLSMKDKLSLVKEKLFQLMQEQLRHKSKFNLIKFDTKAVAWKDRACDVTEQHLLNAWSWVKDIGVGGSTNTLAALRIALSDPHTHAIYLLTDGRPDQHPRSVLAQVQLQHPVPVHTIAFNCNDLDANKFLHQLSADTGGRYHYFTTNGSLPDGPPPFESEDVSLLKQELENGKQDLDKVTKLRARCVMLDWYHNKNPKKTNLNESLSTATARLAITNGSKHTNCSQRPKSALAGSTRKGNKCNDLTHDRPHTSLGHHRSADGMASAHKNHRGVVGNNDVHISKNRKKSKTGGLRYAGHTRTSVLRLDGESNGWMLPETEEFMERQYEKSYEAYQGIVREKIKTKVGKEQKKKKKTTYNSLDTPNHIWLKKHGLVARKLTVMDVLTPTIVKVTPKYVPVLDSYVVSKVFNDVLPLAHVSPRDRQRIRLVNPAAVDLPSYDKRVAEAIKGFKERLDLQAWRSLSPEERSRFGESPIPYLDNTNAYNQAFDRLDWPISQQELQLLVDEIYLGERYLQQSKDLQESAKKLAMGKKSESDTSTPSSDSYVEPPERSKTKPCKPIDRLKGQKVIARDDVDGFYYSGRVIRSVDHRHVLVAFKYGEEKVIPTRFVVANAGAVSCPPLAIGDRVLAYNRCESNVSCFIPGIIINVPSDSHGPDGYFTVLNYDDTQSWVRRNKLIKISEDRYMLAVRYIKSASPQQDYGPGVEFVPNPPTPPPQDPEYVNNMLEFLRNIENNVVDHRETQEEMMQELIDYLKENKLTGKDLKKLLKNEKALRDELENLLDDLKSNKKSSSPPPEPKPKSPTPTPTPKSPTPTASLKSPSPNSSPPPSPIIEKPPNRKEKMKKPEKVEGNIIADEDGSAVLVSVGDDGFHIGRDPPDIEYLPRPKDEILFRSRDDGWYYKGTIESKLGNNEYNVLDYTGLVQLTPREDILTDKEDAHRVIKERSTVVALHPQFPKSYAPGKVKQVYPRMWYSIEFYDGETANVERREIYYLDPEKYKKDKYEITRMEKQWVGTTVVARNDDDGRYYVAHCRKRVGNGHQYELQWNNGKLVNQHLSCIFGQFTNKKSARTNDYVLSLYDPINLIYLPGRVMDEVDGKLQVNFCNSSSNALVEQHKCFWISQQYHDLAVAFYRSKQPVGGRD